MNNRYLSLDVFRGITIAGMILVNTPGSWAYIYPPFAHADWHGYTPTDLVFPFFLIAIGLSMSFSFQKFNNSSKRTFYSKILKRSALIFAIGLALTAFPFYNKDYSQLRIFGVLQRIGLAYLLASVLITLMPGLKRLLISSAAILISYWAVLLLFADNNPYALETNLPRIIDLYLIGDAHMWHGKQIAFDPEGILSTFPAVVTIIIGYAMGLLIRKANSYELLAKLQLIGTVLLLVGYSWSLVLPINKALWTSSYVLVSGGIAALFVSLLMYLIDIRGWLKYFKPFEIFGRNPLATFILSILWVKIYFLIRIDGQSTYGWLYNEIFKQIINPTFGSLVFALVHVFGCWLFAYLLYKKNILIKL